MTANATVPEGHHTPGHQLLTWARHPNRGTPRRPTRAPHHPAAPPMTAYPDNDDRSLLDEFTADLLDRTQIRWRKQAACLTVADRTIFFPGRGRSDMADKAKAVCATCPVIADCLEYALRGHERVGVFGGTTEQERRVILRARRLAAKKTKTIAVRKHRLTG